MNAKRINAIYTFTIFSTKCFTIKRYLHLSLYKGCTEHYKIFF